MTVQNIPRKQMVSIPKPRRRDVIMETRYGKYFWLQRYARVLYYNNGNSLRNKPNWTGTLSTANNSEEGATRKAAAHEFHRLENILYGRS